MESWSFGLEGGGFLVSDIGLELPVDTLKRSHLPKERNLIPFCSEGQFMESAGVTDMLQWDSSLVISSSSADCRDDDDDLIIKMLSSDQSEFKTLQKSSKVSSSLSSMELSLPSKRPRNFEEIMKKSHQFSVTSVTDFSSEVPVCQVHGCNRNLSSSKHYHKKHKVCNEHSKAAQVTVNESAQRFCQQCSRFHLMAEFDDNKRSCRKRLAEHNERRRKPMNEIHWGAASSFLDMASQRLMPISSSFHFPEELSQNYFCHGGKKSSCQIDFTVQTNGNQGDDDTQKQISMENMIMQTLSGQEVSAARRKSRRAFSLLSAEPTSFTLHDCNNAPAMIDREKTVQVHNEVHQTTEGKFEESGSILDLQQLSGLIQRVQQQQQRNSAQVTQELASF